MMRQLRSDINRASYLLTIAKTLGPTSTATCHPCHGVPPTHPSGSTPAQP